MCYTRGMATPTHPTHGRLIYGPDGPGQGVAAITPSDTDKVSTSPARAFYCTGAGNITAVGADGRQFTLAILANTVYPIAVTQILNTGTTATGISVIW